LGSISARETRENGVCWFRHAKFNCAEHNSGKRTPSEHWTRSNKLCFFCTSTFDKRYASVERPTPAKRCSGYPQQRRRQFLWSHGLHTMRLLVLSCDSRHWKPLKNPHCKRFAAVWSKLERTDARSTTLRGWQRDRHRVRCRPVADHPEARATPCSPTGLLVKPVRCRVSHAVYCFRLRSYRCGSCFGVRACRVPR